jgi:glutamate racemase
MMRLAKNLITISLLLVLQTQWPSTAYSLQATDSTSATIQHAVSDPSGQKPFTLNTLAYQQDTRDLPIGVFDSGIGGLTVLEAILSLDSFNNQTLEPKPDGKPDFKDEKFIYLGDQANMPYGNYAAVGKQDYLRELILKDVIFLLGNRYWKDREALQPSMDKPPVKAIAIGCNTATAYGLEDIKAAVQVWNIPVFVVGVVEAGARGVLELPKDCVSGDSCIAVLATVGTCNSGAYPKAIRSTLGLAGRQLPSIVQQGFVELAAAIEGDPQVIAKGSASDYVRRDLRQLVDDHRKSGVECPISTVILGCTHFPLVEMEITETLRELRDLEVQGERPYARLIADKIEVVNPAELTAKELFRSLASNKLRAQASEVDSPSRVQYFISVPNPTSSEIRLSAEGGLDYDYKYGRTTQQFTVEDTRVVPMKLELLPQSSVNLMKAKLPKVWRSFSKQ